KCHTRVLVSAELLQGSPNPGISVDIYRGDRIVQSALLNASVPSPHSTQFSCWTLVQPLRSSLVVLERCWSFFRHVPVWRRRRHFAGLLPQCLNPTFRCRGVARLAVGS